MDPWTTTDVETLLATLESVRVGVWAVKELLTGVLVLGCVWFGWLMGTVLLPSGEQMSWDGR